MDKFQNFVRHVAPGLFEAVPNVNKPDSSFQGSFPGQQHRLYGRPAARMTVATCDGWTRTQSCLWRSDPHDNPNCTYLVFGVQWPQ